MIKPTIGRVVWYHPSIGMSHADKTLAAIVCYVWSDTCINLCVFGPNGIPYNVTSVFLFQGDTVTPDGSYAEWMPYQIGQAKKEAV